MHNSFTMKIPKRLSLLKAIIIQFLIISLLVRLSFYFWSISEIDFSIINFVRILFTGLFFDIGVISFFVILYLLYLMCLPNKLAGTIFDKVFSYFFYFFTTLTFTFSFFAEFTFWEEFSNRFNFIAVDYLVYTFEVIENINQSYPIPFLSAFILLIVFSLFYILKRKKVFADTFSSRITFKHRGVLLVSLCIPVLYAAFINNNHAEWSTSRYENELSKAGIYSFFAAFRNNELSYTDFYKTDDIDASFELLNKNLQAPNSIKTSDNVRSIARTIKGDSVEYKPNVILICVESLSAEFLTRFGNTNNITPTLDTLLLNGVCFENIFATGTRTVRGLEALNLSVPPLPGRSIVKRVNNDNMNTIGDVFADKGYSRTFFYGGDGYFDNMNAFFSGNGFDIVDRGRNFIVGDSYKTKRTIIDDSEVTFENAWGLCDGDIYNKVIKEADLNYQNNKPFFNLVVTTSNHRPYTYPEGKIDLPSGSGRDGAVKYTDFAIGEFIRNAQQKPWYKNTVFVIVADHCAKSAGKWELNVSKYHIPALIYNLPNNKQQNINFQCSQVDLMPTLFGYLNWTYQSCFFGKDVNMFTENDQRAFIGNYRKLGLLKGNGLTVLGDGKLSHYYNWNPADNYLSPGEIDSAEVKQIISYYQSSDYLYKNNLMKRVE